MKVKLKGGLISGTAPRELEMTFGKSVILEELLEALSRQVPKIAPYLALRDELGGKTNLLVIVNGSWLPQNGLISDDDTVEILPPVSGG